jgi:hypothetical protein
VLAELPGVFGIETNVVIGPVKDEIALPYDSTEMARRG